MYQNQYYNRQQNEQPNRHDWMRVNNALPKVQYVDPWTINNNLPYMDDVPDSCCVDMKPGCGKRRQLSNVGVNTAYNMQQYLGPVEYSAMIYPRGCLQEYITQFKRDMNFLAPLAYFYLYYFFVYVLMH
jgi:hypothetical protein